MAVREQIIKSTNMRTMTMLIVVALLWNLIALPLTATIAKEIGFKNNVVPIAASVFLLIGLILVIFAARSIMRQIKFGDSVFRMKGSSGIIGEFINGTVDTSINIAPENGFDLNLSCIYKYVTGTGKQRQTHKETLVEIKQNVERELLFKDTTRSSIPVNLEIPLAGSMESSGNWFSNDSVTWRLDVKAKVPGIDYKASFEVPVRRSYASLFEAEEMQEMARESAAERKLVNEDAELDELVSEEPAAEEIVYPALEEKIEDENKKAAPESLADKEEFYQKLESFGIKIEQAAKTERAFIFPAFRNPGLSIVSLLLTLILAAVAVILVLGKSTAIIPATIFALFALLFFAAFINVSLFRSRVTITKHTLILESGRFLTSSREFDLREIDKVFASGSKLFMNINSDRKIKLAVRIPGTAIAESLADEMNTLVLAGHKK